MSRERFIHPTVAIEPLYNQWYAWWFLIAPATAPLFVSKLHRKIMESFVEAPTLHESALRNPELAGGPYINYPASRAGQVRELLDRTLRDQVATLELAQALDELDRLLREGVRPGFSLEAAYRDVPALLRGYVELTYDLHNRPSPRFIEPLLYRSEHYRESCQSLAMKTVKQDRRAYAFSTPRLHDDEHLHIPLPFRHEAVDLLASMRYRPRDPGEVVEALGLGGEQIERFKGLLTDEAPPPAPASHDGDAVRIRYLGHACVLIETREVTIMSDPVIGYSLGSEPPRYGYHDLPERIDHVLITHGHADHLMLETLLQLRHRIGTILVPRSSGGGLADPSLRLLLHHTGFSRVREIAEMETVEIAGGSITGLPFLGEHGDLQVHAKIAHLVQVQGRSILMAADSNCIEPRLYDHLRAAVGTIDVLFLGMESEGAPMSWMYGPLLSIPLSRRMDQSRRLNGSDCTRAVAMIERLSPRQVYIYAMGREPWLGHVMRLDYNDQAPQILESDRLIAHCRERGIVAERPFGSSELPCH